MPQFTVQASAIQLVHSQRGVIQDTAQVRHYAGLFSGTALAYQAEIISS